MIKRSTGPLVVAYILLIGAGVMFLRAPALTLARETEYNTLLTMWSVFYIAGGVIASAAAVTRKISRRLVSLWYFEMAGLILLITANLVYGYALVRSGIIYQEYNVLALASVIAAFTGSLVGRSIDAYKYARALISIQETRSRSTKKPRG